MVIYLFKYILFIFTVYSLKCRFLQRTKTGVLLSCPLERVLVRASATWAWRRALRKDVHVALPA
jgi:hypothetical protein